MDSLTAVIVFGLLVVLLVEIPLAMRAARRIAKRYRVRLVDSPIFKWLNQTVQKIAFVGGGLIGVLVLYSAARILWPATIPPMPTGMFTLLMGTALVVLLYVPISLDREMERRAKSPDPAVTER